MSNQITLPGYDLDEIKSELISKSIDFDLADPTKVTGYSSAVTSKVRDKFVENFTIPLIQKCRSANGQIDLSSDEMTSPVSVTFGKQALLLLLSQEGAEGLRFWFAINCEKKSTLVVEAVTDELIGEGTRKYAKAVKISESDPLNFEVAPPTTLGEYIEMKEQNIKGLSLTNEFEKETVNVIFEALKNNDHL